MILLVIVGYEKITANPALCDLLAVFHLISNMSLWNNLRTKQNRGIEGGRRASQAIVNACSLVRFHDDIFVLSTVYRRL